MASAREATVEIGGRRLRLSNLHKVFYPATGFTKGDVLDYYVRIAPALLPHLSDRPLTLKRYPDGAAGPFFYEKRCPAHRPPWIRTEPVRSGRSQDVIRFCVVDDLAALVWAVQLADLEMHTYLHRLPRVDEPTAMVFDLDPGPPADAVQCCEVALLVRRFLDRLGLASFAKTSGSKGVQVYVPLNGGATYGGTKSFARAVAERLEAERPDLVVSSMNKALRAGKVLVDWSQNDVHKTTVCAWSLRARERPTVSTPIRWAEVERARRERDAAPLAFDAPAALARFERDGDLFAPVLSVRQRLPAMDDLRGGVAPPPARGRRGAPRAPPGDAAPPPRHGERDRRSDLDGGRGRRAGQAGGARTRREGRRAGGRSGSERASGGGPADGARGDA